jgi:hypothetical protein
VQAFGRQHMGLDQRVQRRERDGTRPHLVGQRRQAELDALAGVALGLPVERLMLGELLEQDHRQQVRARPTARRRVEGSRRLRHPLAVPAGERLAHGLDHLPLARDHFQRLGHILAELHDPPGAAAAAGGGRFDHHALARQMLGERLAGGTTARERAHGRRRPRCCLRGGELVLARRGLELLQLKLELVEEPGLAFRLPAVEGAPELGDLELERSDHGFGAGQHRLRPGRLGDRARGLRLGRLGPRLGGGECRAQRIEIFPVHRHDFDCTG